MLQNIECFECFAQSVLDFGAYWVSSFWTTEAQLVVSADIPKSK